MLHNVSQWRWLVAMASLAAAPFVAAHHSTAMYDSENPIELAGTVVEWQFKNPHVIIRLDVADEDGESTVWALEGMNVAGLVRAGWTPHTLQPGDEIVVTVRPLHSGAPGGNYSNIRWADGAPIDPHQPRPE